MVCQDQLDQQGLLVPRDHEVNWDVMACVVYRDRQVNQVTLGSPAHRAPPDQLVALDKLVHPALPDLLDLKAHKVARVRRVFQVWMALRELLDWQGPLVSQGLQELWG